MPKQWRGYTATKECFLSIVDNAQEILARGEHKEFFLSFCDPVKKAQKYDIVLTDNSVGVAINQFKYTTLRLRDASTCLVDIDKSELILRVRKDV